MAREHQLRRVGGWPTPRLSYSGSAFCLRFHAEGALPSVVFGGWVTMLVVLRAFEVALDSSRQFNVTKPRSWNANAR